VPEFLMLLHFSTDLLAFLICLNLNLIALYTQLYFFFFSNKLVLKLLINSNMKSE